MVTTRRVAGGLACVLFLALAFVIAHDLLGLGRGEERLTLARDIAYCAASVLAGGLCLLRAATSPHRADRVWVAAGLTPILWAVAYALFVFRPFEDGPAAIVDYLGLAGYPLTYLTLVRIGLARLPRLSGSVLIDGLAAAFAAAALLTAVLIHNAVGVAVLYPVGDTVLLATVCAFVTMSPGRGGLGWQLLIAALLILDVSDVAYVVGLQEGTYTPRTIVDVGWLTATAVLAGAAWSHRGAAAQSRSAHASMLMMPTLFGLVAVGVLVYATLVEVGLTPLILATTAILLAMMRTHKSFSAVHRVAETKRLSETDDLTGLRNRRYLLAALERSLPAGRHYESGRVALLLIDLDGFKELNDTLGHAAGDAALVEIAGRMGGIVDSDDVVARLGGDEFAVVARVDDERAAVAVAERVKSVFSAPVKVEGILVHTSGSIGVAIAPDHGLTGAGLLRRADVAMYHAKRKGAGHAVYSPDLDNHSRGRLQLAGELPRAIACEELVLHFQVEAEMSRGTICAAEALLRWRHPERGLLGPGEFLPAIAGQSALSRQLTSYVLERSIAQAAAWRRAGNDIQVAVNLTAADLLDTALTGDVEALLDFHKLEGAALQLEVTESDILSDPIRAGLTLERLRELGVGIALDDFGTGYSSLTHLLRLPVDRVKIDRSFVAAMCEDPAAAAIVEATIRLAHSLGLEVVAEGIETLEVWDRLRSLGCDLAQGYYIGRPRPAEAVEAEHLVGCRSLPLAA